MLLMWIHHSNHSFASRIVIDALLHVMARDIFTREIKAISNCTKLHGHSIWSALNIPAFCVKYIDPLEAMLKELQ